MAFDMIANGPGAMSDYFGNTALKPLADDYITGSVASFNIKVSPANEMNYETSGQQVDQAAMAFIQPKPVSQGITDVAPAGTVAANSFDMA